MKKRDLGLCLANKSHLAAYLLRLLPCLPVCKGGLMS